MAGLIIFAYVIIGIITGTVLANSADFSEVSDDDEILTVFLGGLLWWVTVTIAATYGVMKLPSAIRRYSQNRDERKRQRELDDERHQTALATERAMRAEAEQRELEALGIPVKSS